jgi:ribosomal protein S18 acetylase RimI-like enzyme
LTFEIKSQVPEPDTYLQLRKDCGVGGYELKAAELGLKNSLHAVMVFDGETPIGMGRLVGDGGLFVQVTDIAVLPAYQSKGLGRMVMESLMMWAEVELPRSAYMSLIADVPANKLYEKFGFHETAPRSVGMARRVGAYP